MDTKHVIAAVIGVVIGVIAMFGIDVKSVVCPAAPAAQVQSQ